MSHNQRGKNISDWKRYSGNLLLKPPKNVVVEFDHFRPGKYKRSIQTLREKIIEDRNSNLPIHARFKEMKTCIDYHIRRKNVYLTHLQFDKQDPFIIGIRPEGVISDRYLGFEEGYGQLVPGGVGNVKVGYHHLQKAVKHCLEGKGKTGKELNDWKSGELSAHIACVAVMIPEAVRFHPIFNDFNVMMMHKDKDKGAYVSDKEYRPEYILNWRKITKRAEGLLDKVEGEEPAVKFTGTKEDAENAVKYSPWANAVLAVKQEDES